MMVGGTSAQILTFDHQRELLETIRIFLFIFVTFGKTDESET